MVELSYLDLTIFRLSSLLRLAGTATMAVEREWMSIRTILRVSDPSSGVDYQDDWY